MSMSRVDPRVRAYGKARIDITRRAKDEQEWQRQWKEPRYPFPFTWGQGWKHSFQYQVNDFAAEVGFLMDVLGLPAYAFSPSYAMFTSPDQAFAFSVTAAPENSDGTPPDAIRIQFMVEDLLAVVQELERRGVIFEQKPQTSTGQADYPYSSCFRTPHGICVDLLGQAGTPVQPLLEAAFDRIEDEVDEGIDASIHQEEKPLIESSVSGVEEATQTGQPDPGEDQETIDDDKDPFAGLTFPFIGDPSQVSPDAFPSEDANPEGLSTQPETGGTNGSKGWSYGQPFQGDSTHRGDHRRSHVYPRTGISRGSNNRGNSEHCRSDPGHRAGGIRRKNPFSTQDLPPLPDVPSYPTNTDEKEILPPPPDPTPIEEIPPSTNPEPAEAPKQNGKIGFLPEQANPADDEPRYEDLDDEASKDLEVFYP